MGNRVPKREKETPRHAQTKDARARSKASEIIRMSILPIELLILAAISSPISQLELSPVYGSIPASIYHQALVATTFILAISAHAVFRYYTPILVSLRPLSILAPVLILVRNALTGKSTSFGPSLGPLVTELCTYAPLLYLSALSAVVCLSMLKIGSYNHWTKTGAAAAISYSIFTVVQETSRKLIERNIGTSFILTRSALQYVIAALYTLSLPSRPALVAWVLLLYPLSQNHHLTFQHNAHALNQTLQAQGFSLVARQESLTGYISVLENVKEGFRAMRCDHSLLGGEWIDRQGGSRSRLGEPIYSCFVMLEAVRLVRSDPLESKASKPNGEKHALVIGLGIGTAPSALIAHGIETTIVEIDPVVHQYASQYFGLPQNHTSITKDAVAFVDNLEKTGQERGKYDYIVHDVFTGGAEPIDLFTTEFLEELSYLLHADGVIAINYGGDLLLESAALVVQTVLQVFPSCRLFREEAAPVGKILERDFTNMVIFCRKAKGTFTFRNPGEADFLGSQARKEVLLPKYEIEPSYFHRRLKSSSHADVLRRGQTAWLSSLQQQSALNHWHIMRTVIPGFVWESW